MGLNVRLTDRARADIEEISEYLQKNWSEKVKMDFLIRLSDQMQLISEMPYIYRASANRQGVRECVMNKNTIIFYKIVNDKLIQILSIRSARRGTI